jgi:hypothetical protein
LEALNRLQRLAASPQAIADITQAVHMPVPHRCVAICETRGAPWQQQGRAMHAQVLPPHLQA